MLALHQMAEPLGQMQRGSTPPVAEPLVSRAGRGQLVAQLEALVAAGQAQIVLSVAAAVAAVQAWDMQALLQMAETVT
jgi:hypothetical protein